MQLDAAGTEMAKSPLAECWLALPVFYEPRRGRDLDSSARRTGPQLAPDHHTSGTRELLPQLGRNGGVPSESERIKRVLEGVLGKDYKFA